MMRQSSNTLAHKRPAMTTTPSITSNKATRYSTSTYHQLNKRNKAITNTEGSSKENNGPSSVFLPASEKSFEKNFMDIVTKGRSFHFEV